MAKRIGIIGAGTAGQQLASEFQRERGLRARVLAFFDDDRSLWDSDVSGVPVLGAPDKLLDPLLRWDLRLDEVLLALDAPTPPTSPTLVLWTPSPAPGGREGRAGIPNTDTSSQFFPRTILTLMRILRKAKLRARILSDDFELIGRAGAAHLRAVELDDVFPDVRWVAREEAARTVIENNKVILVAGADLPVGKELCRRILRRHPRRLVLLESSEDDRVDLERELVDLGQGGIVLSAPWGRTGAREPNRLIERLRPDVVFYLPDQRVRYGDQFAAEYFERNVLPLVHFADAAWKRGTKALVMCGEESDPVSMRGLMWRLAQMYLGALHFGYPQKTAFKSFECPLVVDLNEGVFAQWKKQIDDGGPLVEPEGISTLRCVTRRDAAESAIECAGHGQAGHAYVMDGVEETPVSEVMDRMRVVNGLPEFEAGRGQQRRRNVGPPWLLALIGWPTRVERCPGDDGPVWSEVSFREDALPSAAIPEVRQFIEFLIEKAHVLSPEEFKNEIQRFVSAVSAVEPQGLA
jgi:FlaA1/EpsC-like NDP-sugar epimerase